MDSAIPGNNPIIPGLLLTALFNDAKSAESAYLDAVKLGHKSENISVFLSEETRDNSFFIKNDPSTATIDNKTVEGAGVGGAVGSALGALAGVIIAAGTLITLPGIGLVVSGPLVAALAGSRSWEALPVVCWAA